MKVLGLLILTLCIALGALFITGRLLTRRLETEPRPLVTWGHETSFLSTRSGNAHILDVGEGDVVLLVHGSGRSVADWQEGVAERLATSHRVVAFDNYGFGLSDRNHPFEYGNALWARQAMDVLDALKVRRAVVLGHSAGGVVAAFLAADHAERFRGAIFIGHGLAVDPVQIIPLLPGIGEFSLARKTVIGDTFSDRHRSRVEAAYRIRGTRAAYLTFVRRQYTIDSLRLVRGTYEDIEIPVLQMHGTLDESIPIDAARALTSRLADARFVAIVGSSHDVHIDAPDRVAEEVTAFVATLPVARDVEFVVSAFGTRTYFGRNGGPAVDAIGTQNLVEAVGRESIGQFVLLSAFGLDRSCWLFSAVSLLFNRYYASKEAAEQAVRRSQIPYTCVRPVGLLNRPARGQAGTASRLFVSPQHFGTRPRCTTGVLNPSGCSRCQALAGC